MIEVRDLHKAFKTKTGTVQAGLTQKCMALGLPGSGFVVQPPATASRPAPPPEGTTDVPKDERDAPASDAPVREAAPPPP